MSRTKVDISVDTCLLMRVDRLVRNGCFENRSQAIEEAIQSILERNELTRLAREASKFDPLFEQALVEERLIDEIFE